MTKLFLFSIIFILAISNSFSQQREGVPRGGKVSGRVIDQSSNQPIEYANVILFSAADSTMAAGAASNSDGYFMLEPIRRGSYYLEIQFMGFSKETIKNISIDRNNLEVNVGETFLKPVSVDIDEVVVAGEKSAVSFKIDKKVIDVDQMAASAAGNAAEVLENVPSITVDIQGNVRVRGSSNFRVLIDGRPTILDAQDALQQIPAGTIDDIEIITNPSAKYDPEGNAGIINIILKKNKQTGMSGLLNLNAGVNDKYGGEILGEYKNSGFSTILGFDYNKRFSPVESFEEKVFSNNTSTTYINTYGNSEWGRINYGFRGSVEYKFDDSNVLGLTGRAGHREHQRILSSSYDTWTNQNPNPVSYFNKGNRGRGGNFLSLNTNYTHYFPQKGHELSTDISFRTSDADESTLSELITGSSITDGKITTEAGPSQDIEAKLNYTLPIGENYRFEAGAEGEFEDSKETTGLLEYNTQTFQYEALPQFSNKTKYNKKEYSLYSLYAGEIGKFGFQGGLRGEYTYRFIEVNSAANQFTIDDWEIFPTAHFSYVFSPGNQLMASYTRRIDRPNGWMLEPFITWSEANSVRRGNPALLPELTDSYEAGAQTFIGDISLSTEFYYRVTRNKIEGVRSVYPDAENVSLFSFANVGTEYSLGNEILINFGISNFWDVNLMGNLYDYRIEGMLLGDSFDRSSFAWNGRINNSFKLPGNWFLQLNAMYNSPNISTQGRREGFISTDAAVRKNLFNKKLTLILQVRDIFSTTKHENTSEGLGFYSFERMRRESPELMLTIKYSINNFKDERERRGEGFDDSEGF